jgi:hypothetical protein
MARPESPSIAATENYTAANIGIWLEIGAVRLLLAALLTRYERLFDDDAIDLLAEVGQRLGRIEDAARSAQAEGREMRRSR